MKQDQFWNRLVRTCAQQLNLPISVVPDTCEVYLCSNRALYISEHNGILQADDDRVRFRCDGFTLTVYGNALLIDAATPTAAYVRGKFSQICFD